MHMLVAFASAFCGALVAQLQFSVLKCFPLWQWGMGALICALVLLVGFVLRPQNRAIPLLAVLLCGLVCGGLYTDAYQQLMVQPLRALEGETHQITAVLREDAQVYEDSQRAELTVQNADSLTEKYPISTFITRCYLPLTAEPLLAGDAITCAVEFYLPDLRGGFDRQTYMNGQGEQIWASYQDEGENTLVRLPSEQGIYVKLQGVARTCKQTLVDNLPPRISGFMTSLLFGDKTNLSMEDEQNLIKAGMSHMVAVSGMHLAICLGFLYTVLGKRWGTLCSIPVILCVIPMAGASPSILRAVIMSSCACACYYFRWDGHSLDAFSVALLVLLARNPYAIYSLSLQLSFAATLGIIVFSSGIQSNLSKLFIRNKKCGKWYKKTVYAVCAAVACTLSATLTTAPFLLFQMGYLTLYALLANIAALFLLPVTFFGGINLCAIALLPAALKPYLILVVTTCATWLLQLAEWVASLPASVIYFEETWGKYGTLALLLTILCCILLAWKPAKWILPLCVAGVVGCAVQYQQVVDAQTVITLHQAGDGQCVTIAAGQDQLTVIDCGSSSRTINAAESIFAYMHWNGFTRIDHLIFTAVDKGHARNAVQLLQNCPVERVSFPYDDKPSDTEQLLRATLQWEGVPYTACTGYGRIFLPIAGIDSDMLAYCAGKFTPILHTDAGDILLSNSLTQKMLLQTLAQDPVQAEIFVVSAGKTQDVDEMEQALTILQPTQIVVQSGYADMERINGIRAQNTLLTGEISWKTERK